jgi:replicative DNA helicase
LEKLDGKISGLHDGDLLIVAGRPGMGKSLLVGNISVNVAAPRGSHDALEPGDAVLIFSLEMPRDQFVTRMVSSESGVSLEAMRNYRIDDRDWPALTEASRFVSSLPIWVDDTASIDLPTIRSKLRINEAERRQAAREGRPSRRLGLVVIDYLQLMGGREGAQSREQEISEISRGLKAMAKEFKVPIIALSQLNRSCETRSDKNKRPQLSDLRESGAIEQDADTIVFVYRDEYYHPDTKAKGIAELIIGKQRNGPTGTVYVGYNGATASFRNLAPADYPEIDNE